MQESEVKVKIAPNSKESEMMVLGCMLTNINGMNIAADALDDSDFYFNEHKIIFQVLKTAYKNDQPADVHLVCEELKRLDKLKAVGGPGYITTLAQYAGTSAHIEEYANIVHNKSVLRRMINAAQVVEKKALDEPGDVDEALDEAQQLFYQISQSSRSQTGVTMGEILSGVKAESQKPFLVELQERQEEYMEKGDQTGITGIPTHFTDLDKMLNGFNNSNLMILAGRPAMGKTIMGVNLAERLCFQNQIPVGIFSLEMSADQIVQRVIASQSEVPAGKIKTGALDGTEFQRVFETVQTLQNHPLLIDDQPGLKITDLRARARRMKESYGIGFLVVDYLQLLTGSGSYRAGENRQLEISEISRMLKNLARELNIPILCLSQLSRKVEERPGHRPMMSDLRESGCLSSDTLIKNANTGEMYTIKDLAERQEQNPIPVYGVNQDLKVGVHQMTKVFYSGKKVIYELKTRTGRTIKASANHPFLKIDGWTRLDQLREKDRIALPRQTDAKKPSSPISDKELISNSQGKPIDRQITNSVRDDRSVLPCGSEDYEDLPRSTAFSRFKTEKVKALARSDIYWDEIISITELGVEDVYDATVDEVHNFVANDIIVHNSLEQDADIVMFILRREYYDPNDKPGMAELIIGKNRHGGVGTVNLTFRKEITQFSNYTPVHAPSEEEFSGVPH